MTKRNKLIINSCLDIKKSYELIGMLKKIKVVDYIENYDESFCDFIFVSKEFMKKIREKRIRFSPDSTYVNIDGDIYEIRSTENYIKIVDIIRDERMLKDE